MLSTKYGQRITQLLIMSEDQGNPDSNRHIKKPINQSNKAILF